MRRWASPRDPATYLSVRLGYPSVPLGPPGSPALPSIPFDAPESGMGQDVCPVEAIHVGRDFENAEYTRDRFVYDLDRLMNQDHPTTLLWDPSDPAGE